MMYGYDKCLQYGIADSSWCSITVSMLEWATELAGTGRK